MCNLNNNNFCVKHYKAKIPLLMGTLKKKCEKSFNKIKTIDLITIFDLKLRKH